VQLLQTIIEYLGRQKGIDVRINGDRPHDIQVHDPRFYRRLMRSYSLGMGEGYMDGMWSTGDLEALLRRCLQPFERSGNPSLLTAVQHVFFNMQTLVKSRRVVERVYDVGNDLYEAMLDPYLQYTCAYWKDAQTLEEAQLAKMDLICRKLRLQPGLRVLDVGCGWGGLMRYMQDRYGVEPTGITLSKEQQGLARERFGLDSVLLCDYRELHARYAHSFDRVVAVGVLEHVGYKNYRGFFRAIRRLLRDDGIFVLQTIGGNVSVTRPDDWVDRYIFPNGMTPSIAQLGRAMESLFVMEDWHNFGPSYARTLDAWHHRSRAFFRDTDRYPPRFQRMWELYLVGSKVAFDIRSSQLWQLVLSPRGVPGGLPRVD
jgi:cyclopropane-fatty-acyl-phospholipid synthase